MVSRRTPCWRSATVLALFLLIAGPINRSAAQNLQDGSTLEAKVAELQRAGRYAEARPLAERFAGLVKARRGESSLEHAAALEVLADTLFFQSLFNEAAPIYLRVIGIREQKLGANHERVLATLVRLAGMHRLNKEPGLAEPLLRRALKVREQVHGLDSPQILGTLSELAHVVADQRRYADAEALVRRGIQISGKAQRAAEGATFFGILAQIERGQDRPADAAASLERALSLYSATSRSGPGSQPEPSSQAPRLLVMMQLATLYQQLDKFDDAGRITETVLELLQQMLGPDHPTVATTLEAVASIRGYQERYAEAEAMRKRAIQIIERAYGKEHQTYALSLQGLGNLYRLQDRHDEALPLLMTAAALAEKSLGPGHQALAPYLAEIADLLKSWRRLDEAEPLYRRALALLDDGKELDPLVSGMQTIRVLQALSFVSQSRGRPVEGQPGMERALALSERLLGPNHAMTVGLQSSLAMLLLDQNLIDEAERLFERALPISANAGRESRSYADNLSGLSVVYSKRQQWAKAYETMKAASEIFVVLDQRTAATGRAASDDARARHADIFLLQAITAWRVAEDDPTRKSSLQDEAFQFAQRAQGSHAAAALAQMAARFATGAGELAALVRERQDLAGEWRKSDVRLTAAFAAPAADRNPTAEAALRTRIATIGGRLDTLDGRLAKDFPQFAALANPQPLSIGAAQALLSSNEALVFVATRPAQSLVWVVTQSGVRWAEVELGEADLAREVGALRCGLDEAAWDGAGDAKCQRLLARTKPGEGSPLPFDLARAHALHEAFLGPFRDVIQDKHLLVVASGPLTSLPLGVLVAEKPAIDIPAEPSAYATVGWLAKRHAITAVPSIASLGSLRATARPSHAAQSFIGFGNPLLAGENGSDRSAWAKQSCPKQPSKLVASAAGKQIVGSPATLVRGKLAVVAELRRQSPLPETADELCSVARELGAGAGDVRLGEQATESAVKTLGRAGRLANYKVVHFATHGLLASEAETLGAATEPALVLTPPETASENDDGLLTAGEVAELKLDADWVVLSACNTAGGGKGSSDALSGLARAFFYAGARAILASHWYVESEAAVQLVTATFAELSRNPAAGRSEALRRAMTRVMDDPGQLWPAGQAAHPSVWAPFVVIGEGGPAR